MTSRLKMDTRRVSREFGAARKRAQLILDAQVRKDTDPYVPMDEGILAGSVLRGDTSPGTIEYATPYAAYQYYDVNDMNYSDHKHPLATGFWFEVSKSVNRAKWIRVAKKAGAQR